jgi:putative ABC transport system ATP-binding protein
MSEKNGRVPFVEIRDVSKTYLDHVSVPALNGVSLGLEKGEFAAVAGPSGSGKTTLLNVIGALDTPDRGTIRIGEIELTATPAFMLADFRLRHLGFVFQAYNLFPVLTVLENLEFVAALQGMEATQRRRRAVELLEAVGMAGESGKLPMELSGGQQQRVAVLRAILTRPEIVLADEPTANLDSANGALLLDLMEKLNREQGITFLFSTHDALVMQRARRLIRLKDGRIDSDEQRPGTQLPAAP